MFSKRPTRHTWIILLLFDFSAIAAAYFTTLAIRFNTHWGASFFARLNNLTSTSSLSTAPVDYWQFYTESAPRIIGLLALTLCVLYGVRDLYTRQRLTRHPYETWRLIQANGIALLVFYGYFYLTRNAFHPRSFFAALLAVNIFYTMLGRHLGRALTIALRRRGWASMSTATVLSKDGTLPDRWTDYLAHFGISVTRVLPYPADAKNDEPLENVLRQEAEAPSNLILSLNTDLSVESIMALLEATAPLQVPVKILSTKLQVLATKAQISVDTVAGTTLAHFEPARDVTRTRCSLYSMLLSIPATLLILPLLPMIALGIKLSSPGPVFFTQERIGINRLPFRMFKFRTMFKNADEQQAQLEEFNESGDGLFKIRKDPRITPIGRLLRRFSLDEFPQLLNVWRGEMGFVGPRPLPRRDYNGYYEDWHYTRHDGLPGLTCLWTVSGRSEVAFHDMCILDIYYLRNRSLMLDFNILLRTVGVVLFARGAY